MVWPRDSFPPATPAPSWPLPRWCRASCRASIAPLCVAVLPTAVENKPVVLVDVGANVDCTPRMLAQFAVMGEIYSRIILRQPNPRVGLLSIGEEEHKGNELTHAATPLLKSLNLNFIGNVEGSDLYTGNVDVIVCDGFVGNVALKVSEGLGDMVKHLLRDSLESTISGKIGYAISKNAFATFKKRLDYSEYGGAPLLGVRGGCIICHGRSNANAIKNAIRVAAEFSGGKINQRIEDELRGGTAASRGERSVSRSIPAVRASNKDEQLKRP